MMIEIYCNLNFVLMAQKQKQNLNLIHLCSHDFDLFPRKTILYYDNSSISLITTTTKYVL